MFHAINKTDSLETLLGGDVRYTGPFHHFQAVFSKIKKDDVPGLLWAPQMCSRSVYATSWSLLGQRISHVRGRIFSGLSRQKRDRPCLLAKKYLRCTDVCTEPVHTASDVCLHYTDPSTSSCAQRQFGLI